MSLARAALLIGTFNLMTFGNGPVMIPLIQAEFVDRAGALTHEQLLYAFTVARVTPGQANMYVASLGYMLHGMTGAIVAMLAIVLPGYSMIAVMKGYERLRHLEWIRTFTKGLTVTSVGLILAAVAQISGDALTEPIAWIVLAATVVMTQVLKWNMFVSLAAASALGLVLRAA